MFSEIGNVEHKKGARRRTVHTPDAIANVIQQMENKKCFYLNRVYPLADMRPKSQELLCSKLNHC
jgi:hypothetical protein